MIEYVSHLRGTDNATVCGAPWQRWQQHEDDRDSPLEWFEKPRKQDPIHQCQLCLDVTRRCAELDEVTRALLIVACPRCGRDMSFDADFCADCATRAARAITSTDLRIAIADPPYPGQSKKHYGDHPDYAGEVDHAQLIARLCREFDGWALNTSSTALQRVLALCPTDVRIGAWVKPWCAFKKNVPLAYAWEPVIFRPARKQTTDGSEVSRDWISEGMTMKRGLTGAKPERVVHWMLRCIGARQGDDFYDLFPGSGAVERAWESFRDQGVLSEIDPMPDPAWSDSGRGEGCNEC